MRKWPKVFQKQIAQLSPGGLPFIHGGRFWSRFTALTFLVGVLLLVIGSIFHLAEVTIVGVVLCGAGWIGGLFYHGPLTLENVNSFRQLAELIVEKQQRYGFGPRPSEKAKLS